MQKLAIRAKELTLGDAILLAEIAECPRPGAEELRKLARILAKYSTLSEKEIAEIPIAKLSEIMEQFTAVDEEVAEAAIPPS